MIQEKIVQYYTDKFGEQPLLFKSPGRVNLIGEHTDYNDGFVLPAAIDKAVYAAIQKRNDNEFQWHAYDLRDFYKGNNAAVIPSKAGWPNYVLGVVDQLQKAGFEIPGFNLVIGGDVPSGAGMSSSAALECAIVFALNTIFDLNIDKISMVKMAQKAEHVFAGVQCGIMDQFASMMGKKGNVIKLDCRSLAYEYLPFEFDDIEVVLFDSKVKHSLASSEYNTRRRECGEGIEIIRRHHPNVSSLRDTTVAMVQEHLTGTGKIYDRCLYVVEEIERLQEACNDLRHTDLASFGKKMFATHEGLSKLYEVSCPELDYLVECATHEPAILGARMMGGGFGGCSINLIKKDAVDQVSEKISKKYFDQFGVYPGIYRSVIADGASQVSLM